MHEGIFENLESNVRSYCRTFPAVFERALGSELWDEEGRRFIDFFSGAGALNYGHNNPAIKKPVVDYLMSDSVLHALDMHTVAKREFLETFAERILDPRGLSYRVQFTGPTGTNAVEAALKIVRRASGRTTVCAFTGGYHGMSLGALAVTANLESRAAAGVPLGNAVFCPYATDSATWQASLATLETMLCDGHSGTDKPAAVILETVQGEGGVNPAPAEWLRGVEALCRAHDVLLIVDDVQAGCYRTGTFFSFEESGIRPDVVVLSKSIGGLGFPMSLVLMRPELDLLRPGEHTGTFRGNQIAFVAGKAALEFAHEHKLEEAVQARATQVREFLQAHVRPLDERISVRGRGLIWGIDLARCGGPAVAKAVGQDCFTNGLIIERAGRADTVLKIMPPLTIDSAVLESGLRILEAALARQLRASRSRVPVPGRKLALIS